MIQRFLVILLLAGGLSDARQRCLAQGEAIWINAVDGNFETGSNWDIGVAPSVNDVAKFELPGPYTVSFATAQNTAQLDVLGANVIFDMAGNTYTVDGPATIDDSAASLGTSGNRSLVVFNGTLATVDISSPFLVGGSTLGNAELIVGSGGAVSSAGHFEVGGRDNLFENSVTLSDGGRLLAAQLVLIGGLSGENLAAGTVNVTGIGTELTAQSFVTIGGAGTGVLNLADGAVVRSLPFNVPSISATGVIADEAGSKGTVNVSLAAAWVDSLGIDVGRSGIGTLNILTAGVVDSPTSTVARLPGSTGNVFIDGANSVWHVTDDLTIGGTTTAAGGIGSVGVTNSGRLEATGTIRVRSGSQLGGDATIAAGNVNIDAGARLSGTPLIQGNVSNSGTVAPGFSPGTMTISGDFEQGPTGRLEIEIEGLSAGTQHDRLEISGNAVLGGRLHVPVTGGPGFPQVDDEITFLQTSGALGVMGQFDSFSSPNLATAAPGLALRVLYSPADVKVRFVTPEKNTFEPPAGPGGVGNWYDLPVWNAGVPESADIVQLVNTLPVPPLPPRPQQVNIEFNGSPNSENAFAHELNISGNSASMTLRVGGDSMLSVTNSMVVGNNGIVDLSQGGTVTTPNVQVNEGGLLTGNGTINGDIVLGSGIGIGAATLSPGNSVGAIEQNGDLHIQCDGVVEIELEKDNASPGGPVHDVVNISGEATYGGTLVLDLTNYQATPPTTASQPRFDIITAGSRTAGTVFDEVVMAGTPAGLGFDVVISDNTAASLAGAVSESADLAAAMSGSGSTVTVVGSYLGDMDWDGQLDEVDDVQAFVLGLTDPFSYFTEIMDINGDHHSPSVLGDTGGGVSDQPDGMLDFDDIVSFSAKFESLSAVQILEMIDIAMAEIALSGGIATDLSSGQPAASHANDPFACGVEIPEPTTFGLLLVGCIILCTHPTRPCCDTIGTAG